MIVALALTALAASPGDADFVAPAVAAETWLPSLAVDTRRRDGISGRLDTTWAHAPLVWTSDDSDAPVALVRDVATVWMTAALSAGPLAIGATAPVVLHVGSAVDGAHGPLAGDPTLQAKAVAIEGGTLPGLALFGRLRAPAGAELRQLGYPGWTWELGLASDIDLGPVRAVLGIGTRGVPKPPLGDLIVNDQLRVNGGASWAVTEASSLAAELHGHIQYSALDQAGPHALEGVFSGRFSASPTVALRAGLGLPLSSGVGTPQWRAVAGIDVRPAGVVNGD